MKNKMMLLMILVLILVPTLSFADTNSTNIFVQGERLPDEYEIKNIKGNTLVPIRFIGEQFGFSFKWIPKGKEIVINKGDNELKLVEGSKIAYKNGVKVQLPVSPYIKKGVTYVPTRFVSESLDIPLKWDQKNRVVLIGEKKIIPIEDSKTYTLNNGKYSIDIPNKIKDMVSIEEDGNSIVIYEKSNHSIYGGTVIFIRIDEKEIFDGMTEEEMLFYFNESNNSYVVFGGPTDVQFDYENKTLENNYKKVMNERQRIINSFRLNK